MTESVMDRAQLMRAFTDAYEQFIATATAAAQRGVTGDGDRWGPREVVAHLAGWEVMATVRLPAIAAGLAPLEFDDPAQLAVMDDAINATIVTMIGAQSLEAVCGILRQAYQRDIAFLETLNEAHFRPGMYIYERTKGVIEHCAEHLEAIKD
jgi:hypothetical protein